MSLSASSYTGRVPGLTGGFHFRGFVSEICARLFTIRRRLRPDSVSDVSSSPFFADEEDSASVFLGALEDVDADAEGAAEVLALAEEAGDGRGSGVLEAVVLFVLNVALVRVSKGVSRRRASARTASIAVREKVGSASSQGKTSVTYL